MIISLSFPSDQIVITRLHWINNPPKVGAAACGASSAQCPALGSPEHLGSTAAAQAQGPAGEVTLVFTGMPETNYIVGKTGETLNLHRL